MPENSDRLQLIQRAAKRLLNKTSEVSAKDPIAAGSGPLVHMVPVSLAEPSVYTASVHVQTPGPSVKDPTQKLAPSRRARLNFAQLRRLGMLTPDNMTSAVSYDYRAIKRKILANARDSKTRTLTNNLLMVTSALPGEGKTFTAMNLALSLAAERDLHVLLIDGDVVNPALTSLFEHEGKQGLTDLLNGNCRDVAEVLYRCEDLPNLGVIFAGNHVQNTPELLSSDRMTAVCREISSRYNDRIIIIDTPPVLACAEPANIAMHVHQAILVVAASHATRSQIRAALDNISTCPSVSILLNKAPEWHKVNGEPYYYYGNQDVAAQ